jgi:hypothetical protein
MQTLKRKEQEQAGTITSNSSTPMSTELKKKMKIVLEPVIAWKPKYLIN